MGDIIKLVFYFPPSLRSDNTNTAAALSLLDIFALVVRMVVNHALNNPNCRVLYQLHKKSKIGLYT